MRGASVLLMAGAAAFLALAASAQTPAPDPLPPGPEHDLTVRVCSACHAPQVIAQQHLSPEQWKEMVETMASRGARASDEELDRIIAYLSRSFPDAAKPERPPPTK